MDGWLTKRFYLIALCYFAVLMTIVFAFVMHSISPRALGVAVGFSAAVFYFVFLVFFRKARTRNRQNPVAAGDESDRKRLERSIRSVKFFWSLLAVGLVWGLLEIRRDTLWPSLLGITINLLMQYVLFIAMKKTKHRLDENQAGG